MKATSWLVLVSLLVIGMVAVAGAQSSEVTHNTWTSGAAMPTPVTFATAAVLKDEIYVLGGENADNTIIADTQIYNPATNAWSTGVSYPAGIAAASAAVVKNVLYVFGGTSDWRLRRMPFGHTTPRPKPGLRKPPCRPRGGAPRLWSRRTSFMLIGGSINDNGNFHRGSRKLQSRD